MDDELAALVAAAASDVAPPPWPDSRPADPAELPGWKCRVAHARTQHDAQTLELALVTDQLNRGPDVASSTYETVAVDDVAVTVRVYRPRGGDSPRPALLFFHGGGWWMGGGATGFVLNDGLCRRFCHALGAVVVNVDYRLAPEHPFPAQLDDAYAVLRWLAQNASALDVDPQRIGAAGISSGGHLAAALSLLTRDRRGPQLSVVALFAAALDMTMSSPSVRAEPGMDVVAARLRSYYAADEDPAHPYLSPLLVENLRGLPPTVVVTGSYDVLRDDGRMFVQRLHRAGVPAVLLEYPATHTVATPAVRRRRDVDLVAELRRHLCPGDIPTESDLPMEAV